ncbi:MAG: hypothetical protein ACJ71Q_08055 [Terriglobales bacterium]|jgi:hypothetical protein
MKSVRFASLLCMPMLALGAFAYQGSMQQPTQTPQSSGAAGQTSQPPDAAAPGTASPSQPGTVQSPQAQSPQAEPSQSPMRSGGNPIDAQVNALTTALNLTSDQQVKVKTILADQHQQALTFVGDNSLSRDQKVQKMRDLRQGSIGKVRETLTSEQKTKFDNMVQAQNERIRQSEQQQQQQNNTPQPK